MGELLDGKKVASDVRSRVADAVAALNEAHGVTPRLDAVLIGEDPASQVYVRMKRKDCAEVGIDSQLHELSASVDQDHVLGLLDGLNDDDACDGILVQLPLPEELDQHAVLERVDPTKDVDGFHAVNLGRLLADEAGLTPATPTGILHLLRTYDVPLEGANVTIVGRSTIVGKPMAALLLQKGVDATVTVCHSRTKDLAAVTRAADVLVVAVGRAGLVKADMVGDDAVVVDVGINRTDEGILVGDVAFDEVRDKASLITPVPGGVGPLTRAFLLVSTVKAACARRGLELPDGLPG